MTSLETSDPKKQALIEASQRHRKELEKEVRSISSTAEKTITNLLFIGGALALSYFAYSQLFGSKAKKKKKQKVDNISEENEANNSPKESSFFSHVGEVILTQATMAILELARERLSAYLESRNNKDENSKLTY